MTETKSRIIKRKIYEFRWGGTAANRKKSPKFLTSLSNQLFFLLEGGEETEGKVGERGGGKVKKGPSGGNRAGGEKIR